MIKENPVMQIDRLAGSIHQRPAPLVHPQRNTSTAYFGLCLPRIIVNLGRYEAELQDWGLIKPEVRKNEMHGHSFYELCYITSGKGTFVYENRETELGAGELFLSRPHFPHQIISSKSHPLGFYCISFALYPSQNQNGNQERLSELTGEFMKSDIRIAKYPGAGSVFDLISNELDYLSPGFEKAIESVFAKILIDSMRLLTYSQPRLCRESGLPKSNDETRVQRAIRFMEDNYSRAISLSDIAAQLYVSERHANRLFQKVMGQPILQYLNDLRLRTAAQMLMDKSLRVKQVSLLCGFTDPRYFVTKFRKTTGMTPLEFRNRGGGEIIRLSKSATGGSK